MNQTQSSRFEDRLRFHIEHATTEWKKLKNKIDELRKDPEHQNFIAVCIGRLDSSKLAHYRFDPIKDKDYPIELMAPSTKLALLLNTIRLNIGSHGNSISLFTEKDDKNIVLSPNTTIGELPIHYEQVVFLRYAEYNALG